MKLDFVYIIKIKKQVGASVAVPSSGMEFLLYSVTHPSQKARPCPDLVNEYSGVVYE